MKYRVTSLTPLLAGDGGKLSPIDYMVWRDQVNVLDQTRIFRLLAKGPRLEGYLAQLRKADRLDFASWGGFAQNYAERRVPFASAGSSAIWEKARTENLHIPTFAAGLNGPFLPGSVLKGALRTAFVAGAVNEAAVKEISERMRASERLPRRPAESIEPPARRMQPYLAADSRPVPYATFKIYLLRVATLVQRGPKIELGWKQAGATVDGNRVGDSTPWFAEMAAPGTMFEGTWSERAKADTPSLMRAANSWAATMLDAHQKFAEAAGLADLTRTVERLRGALDEAQSSGKRCLLTMGWGGGFVSKSVLAGSTPEAIRDILGAVPFYARAIRTGMPFPKTRRVLFEDNRPSTLPGWAQFELLD